MLFRCEMINKIINTVNLTKATVHEIIIFKE